MLVIVTDLELDPPSLTLPKLRFVELMDNVCVEETPVPDRAIVVGDDGASLITVTAPLTAPADVGRNCALKVVD